jgi:isopentenyl-diphosphate delta-isomerase type 1
MDVENLLVWVDEDDNEIGYGEKMETHVSGKLHRAFSVFVFDWMDGKMLLQRRAFAKYHSGGLWSNACCSHPKKGEAMEDAINERLKTELGLDANVHIIDPVECGLLLHGGDVIYSCGKFQYRAFFENLSENELDHVFLYSPDHNGFFKEDFCYNPEEIEEIRWVTIGELKTWMEEKPDDFTVWFQSAFETAYDVLCRQGRNRDMFYIMRGQS